MVDQQYYACHINSCKTRSRMTMSCTVCIHWFSEVRGSSCWAKIIKSQSQLELVRHLAVKHQYLEDSQSDRRVLSVKVITQAAGEISRGAVKRRTERRPRGGFLLITALTRLPHGHNQVESFMIHQGQLGVKRMRPYHRDRVLVET